MKFLIPLILSVFLPIGAFAQDTNRPVEPGVIRPAADLELDALLWLYRPVIIFADTTADPRYVEQMERIRAEIDRLAERDVIVITDTEPAVKSPLRQKLRPRGFQLVLVDKDGQIQLRKPGPLSVRELTRTIDKLPSRQREVEERRGSG